MINAFKILLILFFLPLVSGIAQTKQLGKADKYFSEFRYQMALNQYQRIYKKEQSVFYVTRRIADCYRLTNQASKAVEWYKMCLEFRDVDTLVYFHLAGQLQKNGNSQEASLYLKEYFKKTGHTNLPIYGELEDYVEFLNEGKDRLTVKNLEINTSFSEFGTCVLGDSLLFSSDRPTGKFINYTDTRSQKSFFDIYFSLLKSDGSLSRPKHASAPFNSALNDGPIAFNSTGETGFVTRNIKNSNQRIQELDVLMIRKKRKEWTNEAIQLPIKTKGVSVAHVCLSANDKKIIFSSNMLGGYGGMDLYESEFKAGYISAPRNLGDKINSPGNEIFPFVDSNNVLYFSSDGHAGLGGLDIYCCYPDSLGYSIPFNMGNPINSISDDFGFFYLPSKHQGYLSSNRDGGKGSDDIYEVDKIVWAGYKKIVGAVTDSYGLPIEADITVVDEINQVVNTHQIKSNGEFELYIPAQKNLLLVFKSDGYKSRSYKISNSVQPYSIEVLNVSLDR